MPKCMRSGCIKVAIHKENLVCDKCRNRQPNQSTSQPVSDDFAATPFHTSGVVTGRHSGAEPNMEESAKPSTFESGGGSFGGGGASGSWGDASSSSD